MNKLYPESKVELSGFMAKHYDILLNLITLGKYGRHIRKVIYLMNIKPEDKIIDLGAGTGNNTCLMMKYLSEKGKIVALDISREMIEQFQKKCAKIPNRASGVRLENRNYRNYIQFFNPLDRKELCGQVGSSPIRKYKISNPNVISKYYTG